MPLWIPAFAGMTNEKYRRHSGESRNPVFKLSPYGTLSVILVLWQFHNQAKYKELLTD